MSLMFAAEQAHTSVTSCDLWWSSYPAQSSKRVWIRLDIVVVVPPPHMAAYPVSTGFTVQTAAGLLAQRDLGAGYRNDCMLLSCIYLLTKAYLPDVARAARILVAFLVLVHPSLSHIPTALRVK
jgi:hypothetical protein